MDTYTAYISVGPTPELTPVLNYYKFVVDTTDYMLFDGSSKGTPVLPYNKPATVKMGVTNAGDETIDIFVLSAVNSWAILRQETTLVLPGASVVFTQDLGVDNPALKAGGHTVKWWIYAKLPTEPGWYASQVRITDSTTYTVESPAAGDITKVQLDSAVLPEGGSLDWVRTTPAAITVSFKNTGSVADYFTIAVKIVDAAGAVLYDKSVTTTTKIPGDGLEYNVTLPDKFTPTELTRKTLTATISP
jgi:hypothetical protein